MDPLNILFGFLIGLLVYHIVNQFLGTHYEIVREELSEEEVERITTARGNLINDICDAVGDAWNVPKESFNVNMELMPHEVTLITLVYKNNLIRIYIYWSRNQIQINLTRRTDERSKIYKKSFAFNKKHCLEKIYTFFEKYKPLVEKDDVDTEEKVEELRKNLVGKLTDAIEGMIEEKVQEHLQKLLEQVEQEEEQDHE